jgi:hypothetical protein
MGGSPLAESRINHSSSLEVKQPEGDSKGIYHSSQACLAPSITFRKHLAQWISGRQENETIVKPGLVNSITETGVRSGLKAKTKNKQQEPRVKREQNSECSVQRNVKFSHRKLFYKNL